MPESYTFRLAVPDDATAFAAWAAENPQIDPKDLEAGLKRTNPTVVTFAVCDAGGKVILFAPVYAVMNLAFIGFNPEARASEKVRALETLLNGAAAFAVQFGVREINTLTKTGYGVAKWAAANGFVADDRELFRYDINKAMDVQEQVV